jgi:hypothetical protein
MHTSFSLFRLLNLMGTGRGLVHLLLLDVSTVWGVFEELLDQVDVGHDHASAAVSSQAQLIHRIAFAVSDFKGP